MESVQRKKVRRSRSAPRRFALGPLAIAAGLLLVVLGGWYTDVRRPLPHPLQPVTGWRWFITPVERNAFMRMPVVTADLHAIDVSDNGRIFWAVGEQGFIFGTIDGGRTWRRGRIVPAASGAEANRAAENSGIADALNPIASALADDSSLKQKEAEALKAQRAKEFEAGAQPNSADSAPTPAPPISIETATLGGVAVLSEQRAVAVGEGGTILVTQDGGETWSPRPSGTTANLLSLSFSDPSTGIVVGEQGAVLRTVDAGETWTYEPLESSGTLWDVSIVDGRRWVIVGQDGLLLVSFDGGQSWRYLPELRYGASLRAVAFADASYGVAVGDGGLLSTSDGGETWVGGTTLTTPGPPSQFEESRLSGPFEDVASSGSLVAALGRDGFGLHRDDGGRADRGHAWRTLSIPVSSRLGFERGIYELHHIVAIASGQLFVAGQGGSLLTSTDGGEHWMALTAHSGTFHDLDLNGAMRGVIVGTNGTLLVTSDGGATWKPRDGAGAADLTSVTFDRDSNVMATAVDHTSDAVTFIESRDAGESWQPRAEAFSFTQPPAPFNVPEGTAATAFSSDRDALVVKDGKVARTANAGSTWTDSSLGTTAPVIDVAFGSPARAVALAHGRVLISDDAGKTFAPVQYRRYPSPWLWVASLLLLAGSALLLRRSLRKPEVELQPSSITDAAASDRPISWNDPDPAGLRDIALGLSRFLRNRRTEPPLTIAVTGEWGTGKSSLMNLLRHDLMRYGYRPVWFNAWHHQSGENLLGSLLANIHAQGVPPLHTLAGLDFKLSLLFIRSRRFWLRLVLMLFLFAVVFFSYRTLGASAAKLWGTLTDSSMSGITNIGAATGLLGIIAAVVAPILGAVRAASAFGLQPAKLIAAVATTRQDESARQQAGARYRFAREFEDFTRALEPRPLVIFIDDLDRCRAENVIEVLEAVNFLITSGRCIVVIGMARRWVETCVGLAFKELAAAHVEERAENEQEAEAADDTSEQQVFARHYLEKLINVEIRVPRLSESAARAILQGDQPATPSGGFRYGLGTALLRAGPLLVLALMIAGVVALGHVTAQWLEQIDSAALSETQTTAQSLPGTPNQQARQAGVRTTRQESGKARPVVFEAPGEHAPTGWYLGTGGSVALALAILVALAMFARKESRTDDSPAFREALSILQPWIVVGGSSPRSLKRFINHVRYIAMRFRADADIPTTYEKLTNRVRAWFGRAPAGVASQAMPSRVQLNEELLVALATLHRCGESWLDELFIARERDLDTLILRDIGSRIEEPNERRLVTGRLHESIAKFNDRFGDSRLFVNEMLDRRHAIAFYEVMACEAGVRGQPPAEEAAAPTPLRSA